MKFLGANKWKSKKRYSEFSFETPSWTVTKYNATCFVLFTLLYQTYNVTGDVIIWILWVLAQIIMKKKNSLYRPFKSRYFSRLKILRKPKPIFIWQTFLAAALWYSAASLLSQRELSLSLHMLDMSYRLKRKVRYS